MAEHIREKTQNIVARDRSEALRRLGDSTLASIYQCAFHLDPNKSMRPERVLKEWDELGLEPTVDPEEFFDVLAILNKRLGTRVKRVLPKLSFIQHFTSEERVEAVRPFLEPMTSHPTLNVHMEFVDNTERNTARIRDLLKRGWDDSMVVEIELNDSDPQVKNEILRTVDFETRETEELSIPYIRVMVKREEYGMTVEHEPEDK